MLKKLFTILFKNKEQADKPPGNFIVAQLNEKVMPIDRGLVYEDPLDEFLKTKGYGEVSGGGTLQAESGELVCCDVEIKLISNTIGKSVIGEIIKKLEIIGAPKGSKLLIEKTKEDIPFGKKEGLALYLNGQSLPKEVYEECDINYVLSE